MNATKPLKFASVLVSSLLSACSSLPSKHIHTSLIIDAPIETVWTSLTEIERYPEWNPYHVKVDGILKVGQKLSVEINKPNHEQVHIEPHVKIDPPYELVWGDGLKGIFTGQYTFLLSAPTTGKTHLIHKERFEGIAIPFASLNAIDEGYERMNLALKSRAERMIDIDKITYH